MIHGVELSRRAVKDLSHVPRHVAEKLAAWVEAVKLIGLEEVRKSPGFRDEPLRGERAGQRSVRLSRAYRAIYRIKAGGSVEVALVEEVNKHEY